MGLDGFAGGSFHAHATVLPPGTPSGLAAQEGRTVQHCWGELELFGSTCLVVVTTKLLKVGKPSQLFAVNAQIEQAMEGDNSVLIDVQKAGGASLLSEPLLFDVTTRARSPVTGMVLEGNALATDDWIQLVLTFAGANGKVRGLSMNLVLDAVAPIVPSK